MVKKHKQKVSLNDLKQTNITKKPFHAAMEGFDN